MTFKSREIRSLFLTPPSPILSILPCYPHTLFPHIPKTILCAFALSFCLTSDFCVCQLFFRFLASFLIIRILWRTVCSRYSEPVTFRLRNLRQK